MATTVATHAVIAASATQPEELGGIRAASLTIGFNIKFRASF